MIGDQRVRWWTRSQSIRTAAQLPFEAAILETLEAPTYQRIAEKARHLHQLGLNLSRIAQALGVSDKTVGKGIAWIETNTDG